MAITSAFQADDLGSIPSSRSTLFYKGEKMPNPIAYTKEMQEAMISTLEAFAVKVKEMEKRIKALEEKKDE